MIFTLKPHDQISIQPLLLELFKTDVLLLNGHDIDGVNHHSWPALKSEITKSVTQKSVKLIILNCTGDPCIIDDRLGGYSPSYHDIMLELQEICKTIIITEDWTYYYKPTEDIFYLPYSLWLPATRSIHKYYAYQDTVYDTAIDKTKPLMCLNRNLVWHRIYMLMLMYNKSWITEIDFSFILPIGDRLDNKPVISKYITEEEKEVIRSIPTPIFLDYENSAYDCSVNYNEGGSNVNTPVYTRCAVNLVTETTINQGIGFSEKTTNAICAYQIPIILSNPGANQHLEDIGIDMFSDYVPWKTWDQIQDPKLRMHKIVEFVDAIMQDQDAILQIHKSFHPRLTKNKEYFHSKTFSDLCLRQVVDKYVF